MGLTFFSFLMAVLWSSAAVLILHIMRRSQGFVKTFGIAGLAAVYGVCLLRLVLPVEFPHIVYVVGVKGWFADFYEILSIDTVTLFGFSTKRICLLGGLWAVSVLAAAVIWAVRYRKTFRRYISLTNQPDDKICGIMKGIEKQYPRIVTVTVRESLLAKTPMGMGLFRKVILLPEDYCQDDDELYYALLHEYTHFVNRDILVKFLMQVICCIFWWNPCIYLLQKELDSYLEIRCDHTVTKTMEAKKRGDYLAAVLKGIKVSSEGKKDMRRLNGVGLCHSGKYNKNRERFLLVLGQDSMKKRSGIIHMAGLLLLLAMLAGTYLVQIQAEYPPPPLYDGQEMIPENTYLVDNGDGTYTCVDETGETEDSLVEEQWLIDDMIAQGFEVKDKQ
ncbi:MAG: M56 family metallopeptidase [Ruminococcus sp.]|jgi:beta-lactamase regulating signal transducer with metallopeptidase domain